MTDFAFLLKCLTTGGVEFIVIGGFAATAHGSAHVTVDLDVVYRRTPENAIGSGGPFGELEVDFIDRAAFLRNKRATGPAE